MEGNSKPGGSAPRVPEREREKERERPPPRDLLKEARERREAARKEAEKAARDRREAEARQAPARHASAPREPARRPDDRDRHAQPDRCAAAVHAALFSGGEAPAVGSNSFWMGSPHAFPIESKMLQQTCRQCYRISSCQSLCYLT